MTRIRISSVSRGADLSSVGLIHPLRLKERQHVGVYSSSEQLYDYG